MKLRPAAPARHCVVSAAILTASAFAGTAYGQATSADSATSNTRATELEEVLVVAQRASRVSTGATNLDLDIKDTPQSISVVSQEQMEVFGADNLNDSLRMATGIQVEEGETNRTQYLARSFEIKNTQIDGVGLPNGWGIVTNAMDSFGFEKLEVIRGANGLLTGVGNSSGTINFVRKRPTNDTQGQFGITMGSWGNQRIQADYSTPFNEDRTWAGRAVVAHERGDSYLRDFESDRTFVYATVDGQIGENGTLGIGYSWQESNTNNNMWGALTFASSDGRQIEWDNSASTTQDWTYWNTTTHAAFVDYTHRFGESWQLKASYNYRKSENDSQLFYAYSETGLDPVTFEGLVGWAYKSPYDSTAHMGDVSLKGKFGLFGREHDAVLGVSAAKSDSTDWYNPTDYEGPAFGPLPAFPYVGNAIPEPVWEELTVYSTLNQSLKRVFGATRLELTDRFNAILGVNWAEYQRDGIDDEGRPFDQTERNTSPYAGVTWDFTDDIVGYASYSYIFQPQEQFDINRDYLDPSKGVNYEVGVKAEWLDQRLLTTLAWFNAEQDGLATAAGYNFDDPSNAYYYYVGVDVESKGIEFEITGKINEYADLVLGYTNLTVTSPEGDDIYPWVPRDTANLMFTMRVPGYTALSFGVAGKWQSDISRQDDYTPVVIRQDSYALFNAFAAWNVVSDITVRANVGNLTDEKYINSLYQIGYYGAPRSYSVTLDWRF